MTVSRALRDDDSIPANTRERIKKIAEKLGYRPDPMVSQLMARLRVSRTVGTMPIAWLTAHPAENTWRGLPTSGEIYTGARARAEQLGYRLEAFWLRAPGMTGRRMSDILYSRGIRGIVIPPLPAGGGTIDLAWERFACATCGYSLRQPVLHRACSHQFHAARIAWDNFAKLGKRRIGLAFSVAWDRQLDGHLLAGFLREQHDATASRRVPPLVAPALTREVFMRWFRQHRPDAILGAPQARDWLRDAGAAEKCALALINIEDGDGTFRGVNHHLRELGESAVDLVAVQLSSNQSGIPAVPKVVLVECSWHEPVAALR
ncbi:hypothetical protein AW736_04165 [Termitidicoccus mucosus]|uniref:HTH lacI-type domain-containing protein n=2 Tax=Termitidicoccus mucosus TaxID=1184151 RepID=A0A178IPV6_9BACT|nr:hypothetical protein AW736_04165 [Opitutaceae bacterium TSB47]